MRSISYGIFVVWSHGLLVIRKPTDWFDGWDIQNRKENKWEIQYTASIKIASNKPENYHKIFLVFSMQFSRQRWEQQRSEQSKNSFQCVPTQGPIECSVCVRGSSEKRWLLPVKCVLGFISHFGHKPKSFLLSGALDPSWLIGRSGMCRVAPTWPSVGRRMVQRYFCAENSANVRVRTRAGNETQVTRRDTRRSRRFGLEKKIPRRDEIRDQVKRK